MNKEFGFWHFVTDRLDRGENVMLLVVAESSGSSPGRAGYKMVVAADGELCGSIGGGVMEVNLVEQCRAFLSEPPAVAGGLSHVTEQVHQKNKPNSSGMICSGMQTVIFCLVSPNDADTVSAMIDSLENNTPTFLTITPTQFNIRSAENTANDGDFFFEKLGETNFTYCERLGPKNELYIVGGGHCALALSELMSRMDFRISIFDDRPELNTLAKNQFADRITIIDSYENIAEHIPNGNDVYVVVMTLGYKSDAVVIRQLLDHDLRYFGVLGSKAKMATLMKELRDEAFDADKLSRIYTPIGIPINSRTPEEIAISIAAEIISIKNS